MGVAIVAQPQGRRRARRDRTAGGFDAVFLAIGAQVGKHLDIPARDGGKMIDAVTLLERGRDGRRRRSSAGVVVVVGGGNTAMDAARIAKRLGAEEAHHRLPLRPRAHAGAPLRGRRGVRRGREDQVADHDQGVRRATSSPSSRWSSTTTAGRSRPASSRRSRPTRWCWRSASTPTAGSCSKVPGHRASGRRHRRRSTPT